MIEDEFQAELGGPAGVMKESKHRTNFTIFIITNNQRTQQLALIEGD